MKYLRLLFIPVILFVTIPAFSQKLSHSVGLDYGFPGKSIRTSRLFMPEFWSEYSSTELTRVSIAYFPRYALLEKKRLSLSIGMPVTLGLGFPVSSTSFHWALSSSLGIFTVKKTKPSFTAEIPVVADINLGKGSSAKNNDKIGVFIGGGYAYNHVSFYLPGGMYKSDVLQPYMHGGIRMGNKKALSLGITHRPKKIRDREERPASWGIQVLRDL